LKGTEVDFVRRGLEELIKSTDLELAKTEVRLTAIAEKFGLNSWRELEVLFKRGIDNPEIDLAWAEYCYLKDKHKSLLRDRKKAVSFYRIDKSFAKLFHVGKRSGSLYELLSKLFVSFYSSIRIGQPQKKI
jgi:hypothetical protein